MSWKRLSGFRGQMAGRGSYAGPPRSKIEPLPLKQSFPCPEGITHEPKEPQMTAPKSDRKRSSIIGNLTILKDNSGVYVVPKGAVLIDGVGYQFFGRMIEEVDRHTEEAPTHTLHVEEQGVEVQLGSAKVKLVANGRWTGCEMARLKFDGPGFEAEIFHNAYPRVRRSENEILCDIVWETGGEDKRGEDRRGEGPPSGDPASDDEIPY